MTSLSLKVNWDLCPVWRSSFRDLTSWHSLYDVFFCACVRKRHFPFAVYWKSLLDIAYAAFLWSCWWKMLYKQGCIGLDSVSQRACQQFIAVWLQRPSTSTAASPWVQLLTALLWLCLPSWNGIYYSISYGCLVGNWSYEMKSHGSLKNPRQDRCAVISPVLWLTLG